MPFWALWFGLDFWFWLFFGLCIVVIVDANQQCDAHRSALLSYSRVSNNKAELLAVL
jgi:hypothetical protein